MIKKALLTTLLGTSLAFGSATIIDGTTQAVSFNSEPDGASVLIDGQLKCKTPCTLEIKRTGLDIVTFKKDGYKSKDLPLQSAYNGVAILSIIWDLSTTDLLSGAAFEYSPNNYMTELEKKDEEKK